MDAQSLLMYQVESRIWRSSRRCEKEVIELWQSTSQIALVYVLGDRPDRQGHEQVAVPKRAEGTMDRLKDRSTEQVVPFLRCSDRTTVLGIICSALCLQSLYILTPTSSPIDIDNAVNFSLKESSTLSLHLLLDIIGWYSCMQTTKL